MRKRKPETGNRPPARKSLRLGEKAKERGHLARIVALALAILALAATGHSQTLRDVVANTNGALVAPTNFFAASGVPTLAGSNAFTGTNTFSRLNIGSTNYGWRYATNNGGQIELAFPGGVAAWYQTGSPAIPYMYFAGTVQADTIVGAISATSINAEALGGQIPGSVVGQSMSPTVQNWLAWQNHSQPAGIAWTNSGPAGMEEPVPAGAYYFPAALVIDGGADDVNTLEGKYLDATNAAAALGVPRLDAASNNFTGSMTLGDASGDTATVNAGTFTAPNATNVGATSVANVGALDARFSAGRGKMGISWAAPLMFGYNNNAIVSTAYLSGKMVAYTNGQTGHGLENFLSPAEWAGRTVRVEAVAWASDASGGLVPLRMRVIWTTNATNNGGYALSMGGNFAGYIGDTNISVYAAPPSGTNPVLWQSPAGTIATNAAQICVGIYIARNATNNTATNTIYLQEIRVTEQ